MRLTWFSGALGERRRAGRRRREVERRRLAAALRVRQLERRRVLDAALASLAVSPTIVVDDPGTTTTDTAQQPIVFDWSGFDASDDGGEQSAEATQQTQAVATAPADGSGSAADQYAAEMQAAAGAASVSIEGNVSTNVEPVLIVALDQTVNEGQLLDLSGTGGAPFLGLFVDPDAGDMHEATVDWGDGSATEMPTISLVPGAGALGATHTYDDNGTYTVTVSVTDSSGASDTRSFLVTVLNVAPTGTLSNDGPVDEGSSAAVYFVGQFDPGVDDAAAGFRYAYDFDNDGAFDVGDGTYAGSVSSDSQIVPASFFADGPGSHTVAARIIDKDGGFTDYTTTIDVLNVGPELENITGDTIDEGETATIGATIVDPGPSDVFSVDVNWLDGTSDTIGVLGAASHSGMIGGTSYTWNATTRQLVLSHQYLDDGPNPGGGVPSNVYSVQLIVSDGADASDPYFADVLVNNVQPTLVVALPQIVNEGQTLDLSGMGGAPFLGLFGDNGILDTHTATVNWGDGSSTEAAAVFQGMGFGTLGGVHTYADNGTYTVTVRVTDDDGGFAEKTFTVTVNNVPPMVDLTGPTVVDEGASNSWMLGPIVDPGADTVSQYVIHWGDGNTDSFTAAEIAAMSGMISHAYVEGLNNYTITVDLVDEDGTYLAVDSLAVTVENVRPTLVVALPQIVNEGQTLDLSGMSGAPFLGLFGDNGILDTHTATVNWGDGSSTEAAAVFQGMGFGTLGGTHTYADNGVYTVTVRVTDDDGAFVEKTFTVTVNNVAPMVDLTGPTSVDEGESNTWMLGPIVDPGADTVSQYVIHWGDGNTDTFTAAEIAGMGGMIAHTYADGPTNYTIEVDLMDEDGTYLAVDSLDVTVNNVAPTLVLSGAAEVDEGSLYTLNLSSFDPGSDTIMQWTIDWGDSVQVVMGNPLGVTHTYADGSASFTITATATDEDGTFAAGNSVAVQVNNVVPELAPISDRFVDEGTELSIADLGLVMDQGFRDLAVGTDETFRFWIDWGDRVPLAPDTGSATVDHIGGPMDPTLASFDGAHTYADNGDYVVTVRVADDNMGAFSSPALFVSGVAGTHFVERTFVVHVANVDPTVVTPHGNLTVSEGQTISFSDLATFTDPGFDNPLHPGGPRSESFTFDIDWGDGRNAVVGMSIADMNGSPGTPSSGIIAGTHVYADDGVYEVTVTVHDDDGGVGFHKFFVTVENVAPSLTGNLGTLHVNEGTPFVLSNLGGSVFDLGLGITDPGFDNPLNPSGATQETFIGVTIDWGDGTTSDALMVVGRVSDTVEGPTTALLQHTPHVYADNGDYTVTITLTDDDGAQAVPQQIVIHVDNVAPTLTLTGDSFTVNEGSVMDIPNLGAFTDPGFSDALNTPPSVETFTYWINWGDGTIETGQMPATVVNGMRPDALSPELTIATMGTLADSHLYADNPTGGNQYTITVRLADDDMSGNFATGEAGIDFVEKQIVVTVLNVNPTLEPIMATDVESTGRTVLNLTFSDPGADSFQVLVDWGERLDLPPDQRFVIETVHAGAVPPGTPLSFTIEHFYTGPPDPLNPTADIIITVKILDDDAVLGAGVVEPGISNLESVAISNPGIETTDVIFVLPEFRGGTQFIAPVPVESLPDQPTPLLQSAESLNSRVVSGEAAATSDRYLVLVVVSPDGEELESYRVKEEALADLRELFATLPENRYKIYLVRTENNSRRLVIDVTVRRYYDRALRQWRGRIVDPADVSEGTRDRPPTSESSLPVEAKPLEENPLLEPLSQNNEAASEEQAANGAASAEATEAENPQRAMVNRRYLRWSAPLAGLALAAAGGDWSQRLEAALRQADERDWQRLRRIGRQRRRAGSASTETPRAANYERVQ